MIRPWLTFRLCMGFFILISFSGATDILIRLRRILEFA